MAQDLIFHAQFIDADNLDGETGLTVTIDVYRTTISDASTSQVVTDGACTETGGGIYRYRYASADLATYHYVANMKTASADVAQKHVAALGLVVPDALVSSRLAPTTAGRTLDVAATGEASANVTYWAGAPVTGAPALEATAQAILEDTGTTLPGLIGTGGVTPQEVWEYAVRTLTQTNGTSTTDSTTAGSIVRRRGDSWSIPLTIGPITGYTSLWFTIKSSRDDLDSAALVQIKLNASTLDDGLLIVNGATASNEALGSITVLDASTGSITVALDETVTDDLAPGEYYYDAQTLIGGAVTTPDSGVFEITADVTRSVA